MIGYIYLLTDTTNGKQYVGQHHYHKEELDPSYHGSGHIIKQIYNKRPETIKEEYVKTCYSQRDLDEWEKYFIFTNNTLYPNGYNLQEGGCGGIHCEESRRKMSKAQKGRIFSEEHKKKIGEANKRRHCSEETRRKIAEAHKGKKMKPFSEEHKKKIGEANKRRHCSEETRRKISETKKGIHCSEETRRKISEANTNGKNSKSVIQFTMKGEFIREWPSVAEVGRNGFDFSHVSKCCRGKKPQYKGFIWKYK